LDPVGLAAREFEADRLLERVGKQRVERDGPELHDLAQHLLGCALDVDQRSVDLVVCAVVQFDLADLQDHTQHRLVQRLNRVEELLVDRGQHHE